jgi:hypothetical protein
MGYELRADPDLCQRHNRCHSRAAANCPEFAVITEADVPTRHD